MSILFFLLGITSIALVVWSGTLNKRHRTNFALANAFMDMQINVAVSHLWFEEAIYGDLNASLDEVWAKFKRGEELAGALLNGGDTEHGLALERMQDPDRRRELQAIGSLLAEFRQIALKRLEDPASSGIGSPLDEQFDSVFTEFARRARALETAIEKEQVANQIKSERLFFTILIVWVTVVILATLAIWSRESRRMAAESALQGANEQLSAQADELKRHQLHLLELVEERTAELSTANRDLHNEVVERQQALEALEESKNRFEKLSLEFHTLLDAIPDSLILLSPDLKVLWANKGAGAAMGRQEHQLADSCTCYSLRDGRSTPCENCPALRAFESGRTESTQISASNGSIWDVRAFPILDGQGRAGSVIEVAADITDKVTMLEESQRVAHLASLGELAAGVAHEINNPINGIINYAQVLIDESAEILGDDDIPSRIIREGNRVATIVKSLLSFAHQNSLEKMPVRVHAVLSDALALSGRQLEKDGITLRVDVSEDLPEVVANAQQIEQVFLNLINNARYALNQKYPASSESKVFEISGEVVTTKRVPSARITFHDRGVGIPSGIMNKLLDPFFSTKPKGFGTGLGLSISHGIVSDHGGSLSIQSVEGEYTKVQVVLPIRGTG